MHSVHPCLIVLGKDDAWSDICSEQPVLLRKMIIEAGVGDRLRAERERLGLNQTDFGAAAGVSRGTQKAYEQGATSPDVRYLLAVQALGVDVEFVLTSSPSGMAAAALGPDESRLLTQIQALGEKDRNAVAHLVAALADAHKGKL